jgi:hypothetical protein
MKQRHQDATDEVKQVIGDKYRLAAKAKIPMSLPIDKVLSAIQSYQDQGTAGEAAQPKNTQTPMQPAPVNGAPGAKTNPYR